MFHPSHSGSSWLRKHTLSHDTLEKEIHPEVCPSATCFMPHSSCALVLPYLLSLHQPAMSSSGPCHPPPLAPDLPHVSECLYIITYALCLCKSLPRHLPSSMGLTITLPSRSLPDFIQRMPNRGLSCLMRPHFASKALSTLGCLGPESSLHGGPHVRSNQTCLLCLCVRSP